MDLKNLIRGLNFPQRSLPQDLVKERAEVPAAVPFCTVLKKPAEKILLRYFYSGGGVFFWCGHNMPDFFFCKN